MGDMVIWPSFLAPDNTLIELEACRARTKNKFRGEICRMSVGLLAVTLL